MKIVIIGAEGAGKTVFLAMLGRYIQRKAEDLIFRQADDYTGKYMSAVQSKLGSGEWPALTVQGGAHHLRWQFGFKGGKLHEVDLLDSAGQDVRGVLENIQLRGRRGGSVQTDGMAAWDAEFMAHLDRADMLIYLLDLDVFFLEGNIQAQNDNAFLLQVFLNCGSWAGKRRVVVVSKADKYDTLIQSGTGSLRERLVQLPEAAALRHAMDEHGKVPFIAISSVKTDTVLEEGVPHRVPARPLNEGDFEPLLELLRAELRANRWIRRFKGFFGLAGCLLFFAVLADLAGPHLFRQKFKITFRTANVEKAGTDAKCYVVLYGTEARSGRLEFDGGTASESTGDAFERGRVDSFTKSSRWLGSVKKLMVGHDDSGGSAGWRIDSISVEEIQDGKFMEPVVFRPSNWLDMTSGLGLRELLSPSIN